MLIKAIKAASQGTTSASVQDHKVCFTLLGKSIQRDAVRHQSGKISSRSRLKEKLIFACISEQACVHVLIGI